MRSQAGWKELYPFESRFWERGGARLHYLDEGKGEPVVMVHGNPSWSFYYRELVKALRGTRRVIVPDHMGMGLSDRPDDEKYEYRLKSRIDDLEELLEHLGVKENVTLVVHDWGGPIGLGWACRHPGRVKRLVIMNTSAFPRKEGKEFPWQLALARTPLGPLLVRGMNAFCRGAIASCVTRAPMPAAVRDGYLAPYSSWAERIAVLRFIEDIPNSEQHPSWETLEWISAHLGMLANIPTLLVWGGKDFVFDKDFYAEFLNRFPHAETRWLDDAGHYVLEDSPEQVLPAVRLFLERHP